MTQWNIAHVDALGVVSRAATSALAYQGKFCGYETATGTLGSALTYSPLVAKALSDLTTSAVVPHLDEVAGRTGSAIRGTNAAIGFYERGQLDMAADAQRNAGLAPCPTPPGSRRRTPKALRRPGREAPE
ncbi:DUF6507 family protein [Luteipulveratus sp. YIM 133132]|uniref:DUF6507 family protein n=1 Tax=Luteipulveratus flavus TaxID=3031728 RepID=UPI0023AECC1E|nr:DUF6507 family protein [Luteipulveratus sp. YIM 133132]MDE9367236.1 DUF6507 family protein [Luteipulveratus sp. YIM 133132]